MSPGEVKSGGADITITTGFHETPFGECLIGTTTRGVCALRFVEPDERDSALGDLRAEWPGAAFRHDDDATQPTVAQIFGGADAPGRVSLLVQGTNFQIRVWEALLRIPQGALVTYGDVAAYLGTPGASRAVGSAVGRNPIAYLIPCHRVRRLSIFVAFSLIVLVAAPIHTNPAAARQAEPVTFSTPMSAGMSTHDPQLIRDANSAILVKNLFVGLVGMHPETGAIMPELARSWTVSDDGLTWTFTLRDDVPWVRWNPAAGEAEIVRMVTAQDVVFAAQRLCDPRTASRYGPAAARIVQGCDQLLATPAPDVTEADTDRVAVRALDDTTVTITVQVPIVFFLSLLQIGLASPLPREIVETYGDDWTAPGTIVTSGEFMVDESVDNQQQVYVRNPYYPADLHGPGNVERVIVRVAPTTQAAMGLYQRYQLDVAPLPAGSNANHPAYADQVVGLYDF
jgi:O-6-methylguanine DNA methyltransferase